jgi:parvulin-like peptidyl-prolyl isomerase
MFSKILLYLLILLQPSTIIIDKIAAVVNNEIITMTDIDKSISLFPVFKSNEESSKAFYNRLLQDLINYKIIYLEYKDDFILTEEDYEEVQTPIINKQGSLNQLKTLLKKFDMNWKDFKNFIKEKVLYEKVLKEKFQINIKISFKEIETFYYKDYLLLQKKLNLKPNSLIEMTTLIEKHLRKVKTERKLSGWLKEIKSSYKIKNIFLKE